MAGHYTSEKEKAARRFWDDMRAAFAEMDVIPRELARVNAEMERLDPSSYAYRALDRRLHKCQKDRDQARQRFQDAQAAFSAYVRAKTPPNSRSEKFREDLETRVQKIKERIDKLSRNTV